MTIWCSGGSEMLTRCMLLLSWGYLASQWLLASVGWAALARRGGSSWWCQRKSCPSLCLSFVGAMFSYSKQKNKTINTGRWVTVQWWRWHGGRAARAAWDAALVLAVQWEWKRFNTRTQWWQYVRLIGRISLSFFFNARGAHKALLNLDTATKDFNTLTVFLLLLFRTSSMLAIWEAAVSVKPWTYIRGRDGEHSDQVP